VGYLIKYYWSYEIEEYEIGVYVAGIGEMRYSHITPAGWTSVRKFSLKWEDNIVTFLSDRRRGIGLSTGFITSIQ
jgi:hypothetical protein